MHFGYPIRKWSLLCRPLFKSRMVLLEVKPKDMLIQMLEKQSVSSVESSCPVLWWRWFYSIWNRWYSLVLFHRSCFEYSQVVGVLKWLIITGEWSMGWCQKRPFHWYVVERLLILCLMVMESVFVILWWVDDWYVVVVKWNDTLEQSVLLMSSLQVGCVCFNWIGSNQLKWFLSMNRGKGETVFSSDHGWYQWWNETAIICISRRSYPTRFIHSRVVIGWSVIIIRIEHSLLDL